MRNAAVFSVWNPASGQWDDGEVAPQGPQGDEGAKGRSGVSPVNFAEFTAEQGMGDDGSPLLINAPFVPVPARTLNPCCVPDGNGTVRFLKTGAFVANVSFSWNSGEGSGCMNGGRTPGSVSFYTPATAFIARGYVPEDQRDASCIVNHNIEQLGGILQVYAFKTNASYHNVRFRLAVWRVE